MKKYKLIVNKFAEEDLKNSKEYYNEQQQGFGCNRKKSIFDSDLDIDGVIDMKIGLFREIF